MIKKIITIKNIGRFQDYSANHPGTHKEQLGKNVLIYGENGTGKTTLSLILNSLKHNKGHIKKRKSFGSSSNCHVELLIDGSGPTTFDGTSWSKDFKDIEIFDAHFVSDNIFTGHEILADHEKNMFQLIVGARELELKSQITQAKIDIDDQTRQAGGLKKQIEQKIGQKITVDNFIKLPCDESISEKIKHIEAEIEIANNRTNIEKHAFLKKVDLLSIPYDFEKGKGALTYTIDSISKDYINLLEGRKSSLKDMANPETWIEEGFRNIQNDKCPFCEQKIDAELAIIKSYTQYFDNKYRKLKAAVSKMSASFDHYLTAHNSHHRAVLSNVNDLLFWQTYIPYCILEHQLLSEEMLRIQEVALPAVLNELEQKTANPTHYNKADNFIAFKDAINAANLLINEYNTQVDLINAEIALIKGQKGISLADIQLKKESLLMTQLRGTEECESLCTELSILQTLIKANNKQMKALKDLLEGYIAETFSLYSDKINFYLERFAPYIRIQELKHKYRGTGMEPFVTYGLYVHDNAVHFQDQNDGPSMKHSLSEGDKSALAFCFFLAKLAVDKDIDNKVVVFDDPISSFDISRKSTTVRMLMEISKKSKQLIVLSHNIFFAYDFLEAITQRSELGPCVTLRIAHSGSKSIFKSHRIDQEVIFNFLKDYNILTEFIENGEPDELKRRQIGKCIRTVLEGYFRVKFFKQMGRGHWLGDALGKIRDAVDDTSPFFRLKGQLHELEDINDYSKGFHHASTDLTEIESINEEELRSYSRRTIAVAHLI